MTLTFLPTHLRRMSVGGSQLPDLQQKRHVAVVATLVSALVGATLFVLLLFFLPRPVVDWMRVIVPQSVHPGPADLASRVTLIFIVATLLIWLAALGARWLLRQLGVSKRTTALAVLLTLAFAASFELRQFHNFSVHRAI